MRCGDAVLALRVKDVLIALMTRFWNETETPNHVAKTKKKGGGGEFKRNES